MASFRFKALLRRRLWKTVQIRIAFGNPTRERGILLPVTRLRVGM